MTIKESRPREANTLIAGTEVRYLKSAFVDQEFRICVGLPSGSLRSQPTATQSKLAVIYALDGAIGGLVEAARGMQSDLRPALVVAIGYPVESPISFMALRHRDFTPAPDPAGDELVKQIFGAATRSGGAFNFLRFIRDELKPFIEANYPVDTADAILVGGSLGGLFATHVLFDSTDTFQRYNIVSPALFWGDQFCFKAEAAYAASHSDLKAKVFIGVGGYEDEAGMARMFAAGPGAATVPRNLMLELVEPFVNQLASRRYPSLSLRSQVFPKETHGSIPGVALSWGLRSLFGTLDP